MRNKILITVPNLTLPGGVTNIYRSINWNLEDNIEYFFISSKSNNPNFCFYAWMIINYIKKLTKISLVQINPSLNPKSIFRDGILLLLAKLFRVKAIIFIHGWEDEFENLIRKNIVLKKLFVFTFNKADGFILLGNIFQQKLENIGVKLNRIRFCPTVADDRYLKIHPLQNIIKKNSQTIRLLFISRFDPMKGMDIVLNTIRLLNETNKNKFELVMAGDGPELLKCKKYVQDYNLTNVKFTGYLKDLEKHKCFSKSDILFFPSLSEGLPCVIMEAMLYGLAIVTRPIGGIPDWVKHGINGWISESKNPKDFADGILSLVRETNLINKISHTNKEIAMSYFTPEQIKKNFQIFFKTVLDAS